MRIDPIMTTQAAWCRRLSGLVSIDDAVLAAQNVRAGVGRVSFESAMAALDAICRRSTGKETFHGDAQQHPRAH